MVQNVADRVPFRGWGGIWFRSHGGLPIVHGGIWLDRDGDVFWARVLIQAGVLSGGMFLSGLELDVLQVQDEFSLLEELVPEMHMFLVYWGISMRSLNVFIEQFGMYPVFCNEGFIAECHRRPALFCILQRG